ncbi:MAG: peptide deformylase [Patescibacteria group bacterium]
MAVQKILTVPNPVLRQKAKRIEKIDRKILKLVKDLKDTLEVQENPRGVGLSAPQIGVSKRVLVLKLEQKIIPFINPEIVFASKETLEDILPKEKRFMEGCLSVPGFWGFVNRHFRIKVSFQNLTGAGEIKEFAGREASFFQHELDHLDGILFIDRILKQKGRLYKLERSKDGKDVFTEIEIIPS